MMLVVAFKDCDIGVLIQFRTDGRIFNLRPLQAHTKEFSSVNQDLLFADDCALVAHTQDSEQQFFDRFAKASSRFRLTVSLKKTEVLQQSPDKEKYSAPVIQAGGTVLKSVDSFYYIGRLLSISLGHRASASVSCKGFYGAI